MIVRTYNKREYVINAEQATRVIKAMEEGKKYIKIHDSLIAVPDIRSVEPGGYSEVPQTPQLVAPEPILSKGYEAYKQKRKELFNK